MKEHARKHGIRIILDEELDRYVCLRENLVEEEGGDGRPHDDQLMHVDSYRTCNKVIQNENTLRSMKRKHIADEDYQRFNCYHRTLKILDLFERRETFQEIFGNDSPWKIIKLFGENSFDRLKAYARKKRKIIRFDEDMSKYKVHEINWIF